MKCASLRIGALSLALIGTAACGGYQPGTLAGEHARQFHCVDAHVDVDPRTEPHRLVLAFEVGNRCREPVDLDFSKLQVMAGHSAVLDVYDPNGELREAQLDGERHLQQALQFYVPEDLRPLTEVCVVYGEFADGSDSDPMCFEVALEPRT